MQPTVLFLQDEAAAPWLWRRFLGRFAACGYACLMPAPCPPHERPIDDGQARLEHLLSFYESLIRAQPAAPVLLGHGLGGLLVQILLCRGLGAAGIALAPLPGRRFPWSRGFLRSMENQVDFGNDQRAPLLLVADGADRLICLSGVAASYRRHRRSAAETDFLQFPTKTLGLIAEPGWEAVADACLDWLQCRTGRF